MKKVAVKDISLCNGCRLCEMICSFVHTSQFQPTKSMIRVHKIEVKGLDMPVVDPSCDLCKGEVSPQCVRYCPTIALEVVEFLEGEGHILDRIRIESSNRRGT